MNNLPVIPQCEFEDTTALDILDALQTLRGGHGHGCIIGPPGDGPDVQLAWALQEITQAFDSTDEATRKQFCTNAVMNSRRSLACLVDWFLERDLAKFTSDPPDTPKKQAAFLVSRGIIDSLTSRVLERAVDLRNKVEHQFCSPTLPEAENFVELLRRTINMIANDSNPSRAPFLFGSPLYAIGAGERTFAQFHGWTGSIAVVNRFALRKWVGVIVPSDESHALVRRVYLNTMTTEQLVQILSLAEQKFGKPSSSMGTAICELFAKAMGLI